MMWLLFMYRNSDELEKLARRVSSSWASFRKPEPGELKRKAESPDQGARYVAVNCNNRDTFELRFFKSTLSAQEFYAAIEFADASVKYTKWISSADVLKGRALTWADFAEFALKNGYTNLVAEISK